MDSIHKKSCYEAKSLTWQQVIKFILGMAVLIVIKILVKEVLGETLGSDYIRYLLIGFWITVATPLLLTGCSAQNPLMLPIRLTAKCRLRLLDRHCKWKMNHEIL